MGIDPGSDPLAALNRWSERKFLVGPDDHDDPDMVAAGYTPRRVARNPRTASRTGA
jgi:hypothetical protein